VSSGGRITSLPVHIIPPLFSTLIYQPGNEQQARWWPQFRDVVSHHRHDNYHQLKLNGTTFSTGDQGHGASDFNPSSSHIRNNTSCALKQLRHVSCHKTSSMPIQYTNCKMAHCVTKQNLGNKSQARRLEEKH
jgi:hypothetical protein